VPVGGDFHEQDDCLIHWVQVGAQTANPIAFRRTLSEMAVVVSNDSDLLEPIKIVRGQLGKKVGILNPHPKPSRALLPHIDFIKQIRAGALRAAQFPAVLQDGHGTFTKPPAW
jgi:hypothetical protein